MKASPRKRRPREESRESIVRQAVRLFARHGFHGTSFQAIADACGIRQTTVLYHFPSRAKLLQATLDQILRHNHAQVTAKVSAKDSPGRALLRHFEANLHWAIEFPQEAEVILLLYYFAASDRSFAKLYAAILSGARQRIEAHLIRGVELGVLPRKLDTTSTARTLHDSLLGGIVNYLCVRKLGKATSPQADWERQIQVLFGKDHV